MDNHTLSFSVEALSAATGISRSLIYMQIASGQLRAHKLGRRTLIRRADAEAWLAALPIFERSQEVAEHD